ncbi:hypothetical protein C8R43DRAFT_889264, partial [Mycena crocata]
MLNVPFAENHLESDTHVCQVKTYLKRCIPVPIGPAIPRRDTIGSVAKHARLMLILFKPWRHAADLRHENQTWVDAFQQFTAHCSEEILERVDNMQILHECKDSRDDHFKNRR